MIQLAPVRCDLDFVSQAAPDPAAFAAYVRDVIDQDGVDESCPWHLGIDEGFVGFMDAYWHYAQLIQSRVDANRIIVVDVGCCAGFQQVFFPHVRAYIGIDYSTAPCRPFLPHVEFWEGAWSSLEIQDRLLTRKQTERQRLQAEPRENWSFPGDRREPIWVGIANMSLLYGGTDTDLTLFYSHFQRHFIQ